jgi:tetratricopeptide (TPR) repeat protein
MAQRALVMVPPDLFPAKNLARVRLIMRHYRDSREACLRAAIIAPNDPEVWYMMGICLLNEKLPNAKENLQKAITLGLAGDDLVQAQEALRRL